MRTLFTHQLFTILSFYYYGFVPSVVSPSRPPLPSAHKSQTQSSRPWREPSNHQQPPKKGRGYLTLVPISSHSARTHTWLMRPGVTGYNSEVFYQRVDAVCTTERRTALWWEIYFQALWQCWQAFAHIPRKTNVHRRKMAQTRLEIFTVVQMRFIVKTSSIWNGCCCKLRIKFRAETPQERWASERTEAFLSV